MAEIKTPETHPDHHTVGVHFKGDGVIWYCDSYDPSLGYWLTPVYGERRGLTDRKPERTNVSERAIDRTFHTIHYHPDDKRPLWGFHCRHTLSLEERQFLLTTIKGS